jgi:hypothetical protein
MHREFEELGLTIEGVAYGHFTGEVQFDENGAPVIIDISRGARNGWKHRHRCGPALTDAHQRRLSVLDRLRL